MLPQYSTSSAPSNVHASVPSTSLVSHVSTISSSSQSTHISLISSYSIPVASTLNLSPTSVPREFAPDALQFVLNIPPPSLHRMQTRSKSGIVKKKNFFSQCSGFWST